MQGKSGIRFVNLTNINLIFNVWCIIIELKQFEREGDDVEPAAPQGLGAFDGGSGGGGA